jgi:acylphosphatase
MSTKAVLAKITGRVQGVGFREWTRRRAEGFGLRGWVRNEADGSVSALLAGQARQVDAMVAALHGGPPAARVHGVGTEPADVADAGDGFLIL